MCVGALAVGIVLGGGFGGAARAGDDVDLPRPGEVIAVFDHRLAKLGLRITRANLESLKTGEYAPNGRHLAVYVEPTGAYADEQYVENFPAVADVFLSDVFERWDIRSFDVCQEPLPSVDGSAVPPPVTQLLVTRQGAKGIRWQRASLADLLELEQRRDPQPTKPPQHFYIYFDIRLKELPAYQEAAKAAGRA